MKLNSVHNLCSIQANSLIALGRIFDKDSRTHNVKRLTKLAEGNPAIFSKHAMRQRKSKILANNSTCWKITCAMCTILAPPISSVFSRSWMRDAKFTNDATSTCAIRDTHTERGPTSVVSSRRPTSEN